MDRSHAGVVLVQRCLIIIYLQGCIVLGAQVRRCGFSINWWLHFVDVGAKPKPAPTPTSLPNDKDFPDPPESTGTIYINIYLFIHFIA